MENAADNDERKAEKSKGLILGTGNQPARASQLILESE
jgi:hypothetical protein